MAGAPLSLQKLLVDKEFLKDVKILAAIDKGCSLTKILCASKTSPDATKHELNFALFENTRFEEGLKWLKQEVDFPESGVLHVTGTGCDKEADLIKSTLGLDIMFVDEFMSQTRGAHFMINNLDEKDITFPEEAPREGELKKEDIGLPDKFQRVMGAMNAEMTRNMVAGNKFPALLVFVGSAAGVQQINEDSSTNILGGTIIAGKFFLSLSKLLLGTGEYDEIMSLAEKGNRSNIDATSQEIIDGAEDAYWKIPPDTPVFCLGKASDQNRGLDDFKREDLARSIIATLSNVIIPVISAASLNIGVNKVYMGGNFVRHPVVRREIKLVHALICNVYGDLDIKFLNTGHTGALGAMITNAEEEKALLQ